MADPFERAAKVVRRVQGDVSAGHHQASRAAFLNAIEKPPRRRWVMALPVAVAAVALLAFLSRPLTYSEEPSLMRFSDGTVIEGPAEVISTDARGAVVRVTSGVLHANVQHRVLSRWAVQVGPYTVRVTGTRFSAGLVDGQIDVELLAGSVEVSGPGLAAPLQLKAGQRFRTTVEKIEVSNVGEPRTAKPIAPPLPAPPVVRPAVPKPPPRVSWHSQVAAGDFAEVVAAARAEGLDQAMKRDLAEVFALGEAARYVKDDALAKRCFVAVRDRAPKSIDAAQSALLLGRISEQQAQWAGADHWYERCELDGHAALIPEALGRRVVVLEHLGQLQQAKAVARRYLALDPSGPWAAVARRMIE